LGRLGDPARLAGVLGDDEPPAVRLAATCARGGADEALLETFLAAEDATLRAIALEELRARAAGSEAAARALARAARTGAPGERVIAFGALAPAAGRRAGPEAAPGARHGAAEPGPDGGRPAASAAPGPLVEPRRAPLFARALADRTDAVRDAAAAAIARLGAAGLPALLVAARFGRRSARHAALETLRELES